MKNLVVVFVVALISVVFVISAAVVIVAYVACNKIL